MISVEEARDRILTYVAVLEAEEKPLLDALGQVLAEDVYSALDIPPMDNTAMDGYALRAADTRSASRGNPLELRVTGEAAAGYVYPGRVEPGTAVRIMTGAPIPVGADAVAPFEETDEMERKHSGSGHLALVRVYKEVEVGESIRPAGGDVRAGDLVLTQDTVLRPSEIGVLASLGRTSARVIRRPVVAILSTGDELVELGQPLGPGQIYDANSYSLAAAVVRLGAIARPLGIARDTVEALTARIREGLAADILLTSAGVSRGDYDIVKDVLAKEGEIAFWSVAMKPGKPLAFGCFYSGDRRIPHVGLPGNPVSAMVTFEVLVRQAILRMMGKAPTWRPTIKAIALDRIVNRHDPRRYFARCVVTREGERYYARLTGPQGSNILTSMARANALTDIPEGVEVVEQGEEITVMMLDWSYGD